MSHLKLISNTTYINAISYVKKLQTAKVSVFLHKVVYVNCIRMELVL
jgi:hypothetical protein